VIDLHTHVLPGIDDGPDTVAGSVAVAETALHAGTRVLVATPHLREDHPRVVPEELRDRAAVLQAHLRARGMDVEILPGAELDARKAATLSEDQLKLATLGANNRDLLLETPYGPLDDLFDSVLLDLVVAGFRVTLAHPERNPTFQAEPEVLGRFVEQGVLTQVTARSLSTRNRIGAVAAYFLREGWVHVLASDAHAVDKRPPSLNVGLQRAAAAFPEARAELAWMVTDAPRAIVDGVELPERPARPQARKRFRLLRR
jgi:protein-tyrosine phosphatase